MQNKQGPMASQRSPRCLPQSSSHCSLLKSLTLDNRLDWLDPKETKPNPMTRTRGSGSGAWKRVGAESYHSFIQCGPGPQGQGVGYSMTKPREKSSAGCGPVVKSPLCWGLNSLVTQGRVC